MNSPIPSTKCGFVCVIGAPNAGKSTLINHLTGAKVSIVSPKVQTTRTRVLGIVLHENAQIIFADTPGIFEPSKKNKLERAIVGNAWDSIHESDAILLLVDAARPRRKETALILKRLRENKVKQPVFLALNKTDKIKGEALLKLAQDLHNDFNFTQSFMISALKGDGTQDILRALPKHLPESPFLFPEDQISDMPARLLAAEITREKLFYALRDELPYNLTVETEEWEAFDNGSIKINQTIYVTRETHRRIILGKGGAQIKAIGTSARAELKEILETDIHLKLFVKVREDWLDKDEHYTLWGLTTAT